MVSRTTKTFKMKKTNDERIKILRNNIPEFDIALHINKSNVEKLEWYDNFVDYLQELNPNLYNDACEYADNKKSL